jgi:NAD(P)-dependent dehydrogenase (short-subunit alcohol dehydrogenase family)
MAKRKNALVTGASAGVGRATAIALAERGIDVAWSHRDNPAQLSVDLLGALMLGSPPAR